MTVSDFVEALGRERCLAVLRTSVKDAAGPAMAAALDAGFRIGEFTLNTPGALELITEFSRRDDVVIGAGTVLTSEDVAGAIAAGARFLVSPVVDVGLIREAAEANVTMIPGTHTPTEMLKAHDAGAPLQKLFPAPGTGPAYVKACLGPMPFLRIVPTSGVDGANAAQYLDAGAFAVGFVAPLFEPTVVADRNFEAIGERARELLESVNKPE